MDEDGRDDAATLLLACLEDDSSGRAFGDGLELFELRDQQDHIEEVVESLVLLCRNIHRRDVAAP